MPEDDELEQGPWSDETLIAAAEELFLDLDAREAMTADKLPEAAPE
jgi:hypothetical protein